MANEDPEAKILDALTGKEESLSLKGQSTFKTLPNPRGPLPQTKTSPDFDSATDFLKLV